MGFDQPEGEVINPGKAQIISHCEEEEEEEEEETDE
jgi:hypothetical protein